MSWSRNMVRDVEHTWLISCLRSCFGICGVECLELVPSTFAYVFVHYVFRFHVRKPDTLIYVTKFPSDSIRDRCVSLLNLQVIFAENVTFFVMKYIWMYPKRLETWKYAKISCMKGCADEYTWMCWSICVIEIDQGHVGVIALSWSSATLFSPPVWFRGEHTLARSGRREIVFWRYVYMPEPSYCRNPFPPPRSFLKYFDCFAICRSIGYSMRSNSSYLL